MSKLFSVLSPASSKHSRETLGMIEHLPDVLDGVLDVEWEEGRTIYQPVRLRCSVAEDEFWLYLELPATVVTGKHVLRVTATEPLILHAETDGMLYGLEVMAPSMIAGETGHRWVGVDLGNYPSYTVHAGSQITLEFSSSGLVEIG